MRKDGRHRAEFGKASVVSNSAIVILSLGIAMFSVSCRSRHPSAAGRDRPQITTDARPVSIAVVETDTDRLAPGLTAVPGMAPSATDVVTNTTGVVNNLSQEQMEALLTAWAALPQPRVGETDVLPGTMSRKGGFERPWSSRSKNERENAGRVYCRGGAGFGASEGGVLRALRWLKASQEKDGAWRSGSNMGVAGGTNATGLTSLGLLAFLGHGETPASEEFGQTVEEAIQWLVYNQKPDGTYHQNDNEATALPLAAYALAEAYGITKVPTIELAADKIIDDILKKQLNHGLWLSKHRQNQNNIQKADVLYSAWCIQALSAARMAGLRQGDTAKALKKAVEGLTDIIDGTFQKVPLSGITESETAAAVLSMQLAGHLKSKAVLEYFSRTPSCPWEAPSVREPLICWYYVTSASFNAGGQTWNEWNKQYSFELVKNQYVIKQAAEDPRGNKVDIGYWKAPTETESQSLVYSTTLCTLILEVYYRYPPEHAKETIPETEHKNTRPQTNSPPVRIDINM
jgi:hypothetical protein